MSDQPGAILVEPLHLIGGWSTQNIAAVLYASPDGVACWWNERLIRGSQLYYVNLWAQRQVATGWRSRSLRSEDLAVSVA